MDRDSVLRTSRLLRASPSLQSRAHGERAADDNVIVELARRMGVDPATDPRPETVAVAMGAAAGAAFGRWVAGGGRGDPADLIAAALTLLERGLVDVDVRGPTGDRAGPPDPPTTIRQRRRSAAEAVEDETDAELEAVAQGALTVAAVGPALQGLHGQVAEDRTDLVGVGGGVDLAACLGVAHDASEDVLEQHRALGGALRRTARV